VDTDKLEVGTYHNSFKVINESDDPGLLAGLLSDQPIKQLSREINITVTQLQLAAPVMGTTTPTSSSVSLTWTYPDSATANLVLGYNVYITKTPNDASSWKQFTETGLSIKISGLLSNTTYYFAVAAYGKDSTGPRSQAAQITTLGLGCTKGGTNALGMTFVSIPAGTFMMGSPTSEEYRNGDETQHQVTLTEAYCIQTTEVTQGQWRAVMGSDPSYFKYYGDDYPVEQVSAIDIINFIDKMSKLGYGRYRLPTEAQWEYAARAKSTTAFANGGIMHDDKPDYYHCSRPPLDSNLDAIGWYCGNASGITHPVKQKQPNAWGLYDMHGNVSELLWDWYESYPTNAVTDPTGNGSSQSQIVRGGNFYSKARECRSAFRENASMLGMTYLDGYRWIGFRLVRMYSF